MTPSLRLTSKITRAFSMRCATCERTSRFTITSGFIKRWTIKHQRRSIQADKTDILEWLCFVLFSTKNCLDFWDHHILLPENLFYNTTAPGIILLLNRHKPEERKGQFILINTSAYFVKEKPKNVLTDEGIAVIAEVYRSWETREKLSKVINLDDLRASDFNISPSQFVEINSKVQHRPINEILIDLAVARAERENADIELDKVLSKLGLSKEE